MGYSSAAAAAGAGAAAAAMQSEDMLAEKYAGRGGRKLFIGQLPKDTQPQDLRQLMSPFGSIEDLHLIKERRTGKGTGAAFVVYETREAALQAVEHFDGKVRLQGVDRAMHVRLAEGEVDSAHDVKLFVGHVPINMTESELYPLFQRFGDLLEVVIIRRPGRCGDAAAFVRYGSRESAELCIAELHQKHHVLDGGTAPITVRPAHTEAEKRLKKQRRGAGGGPQKLIKGP